MIQIIDESLTLVLALSIGMYAFRYMNLFYRILFYQLLAYILIYILSYIVNIVLRANNLLPNNQWVYNISMPIEAGILTWGAYEYFKKAEYKFWIWIGFAGFLAVFITELFIKSVYVFSNHGYIAESILLLILYLMILFSHFTKQNNWFRSPELWICIGMAFYFGGVIPYFSLMHYLQANYPKVNAVLYYFIIDGLATLRYLLLALGFWFVRSNALQTASLPGNKIEAAKQ